mmetsp:Transcript_26823/g.75531  ORF Transcript_26823/g.75531 Transcript_26823/m.75531 type:complete len:368 (-) Transcript_26823:533-1636(-)
MDAVLRHLRGGAVQGDGSLPEAPLALVEVAPSMPGGTVLLMQVFRRLCEAIAADRCQAKQGMVLAAAQQPGMYKAAAAQSGCPVAVVDCFSDPWGWNRTLSGSGGALDEPTTDLSNLPAMEAALTAELRRGVERSVCVVIDCLSMLLSAHPPHEVAGLLYRLTLLPAVSSCVALLHGGGGGGGAAAVRAVATVAVRTLGVPPLQAEGAPSAAGAHGVLDVRLQRHTGRVFVDQELFTLLPEGGLLLSPVPQPPTAQQLAAAAITKAASSKQEAEQLAKEMMVKMDGGMKLTLTEEERAAKEAVVLPYEHRGDRGLYDADDFTHYLPPAAGGVGAGSGKEKLGHILYIRDSDEGEYDSDEDPDDDLDI